MIYSKISFLFQGFQGKNLIVHSFQGFQGPADTLLKFIRFRKTVALELLTFDDISRETFLVIMQNKVWINLRILKLQLQSHL